VATRHKARAHPGNIRAPGADAGEYSLVAMKTILVPLDLSPATVRVCDTASDLARLTGARLILMHIVQPPPVMMSEVYAFDDGKLTELVGAAKKIAARKLRALEHRCEKRGLLTTSVLREGAPAAAILAKAASAHASCIVMGSHGHGAIYDLLVGSTTHGVLKKAPCPVLVVPPSGRRAGRGG
jgi:nucleotide-binding universal stress UspA family protein